MSYWKQKVVVITGGSSGLGKSIAAAFGRAGAEVIIAARDQKKIDNTVAEFQAMNYHLSGIATDITKDEEVQQLFDTVENQHGRIDALVNNAGISARGGVLETSPAEFQQMMELNLYGVVRCTNLAAKHLIASKGHLINIGSLASKTASPHLGPYVATKFALAGYTHQLRLELNPQGVHVLLVCPGPIRRTDANQRYADQTTSLPETANQPGGGTKVTQLAADKIASKILHACEKRKPELILPKKAKFLFAISTISPSLGDWLLRKFSS